MSFLLRLSFDNLPSSKHNPGMSNATTTSLATTSKTDILAAFRAAAAASFELANTPDDGSCNMDFVLVESRRSSKLEAAALAAGLRATYRRASSRLFGGYWINASAGQAGRNTRQCIAIASALRAHGLRASVEYVTD